jgi:hypothetical protein
VETFDNAGYTSNRSRGFWYSPGPTKFTMDETASSNYYVRMDATGMYDDATYVERIID